MTGAGMSKRGASYSGISATRVALGLAAALYIVWVGATYLLEGNLLTLQRPDATGARLAYALVANLLVGIGGSALVLRYLSKAGVVSLRRVGFRRLRHAAVAVLIGATLGFAIYAVQGAPSFDPMVILNAYAQVLVVSVAEVLVCWAVAGSVVESVFGDRGRWVSVGGAILVSSVLFGLYHFAHSPPFNTVGFVALLTVIGLVTSAFFFASRDVYGTIAFHNFLGIFGVISALESSGGLGAFGRPVIPLLVMAAVTVVLLIAVHVRLLGRETTTDASRVH